MPATQLWLAHNGPAGKQPDSFARFPAPDWRPDGGWRVDPALIYAHTLQESGFRSDVVSSAGARGLMQVLPGTGSDMGLASPAQLFVPSTNMEYGQRYLENLRNMSATGGLLPKVMAAYNAGPLPVERWNSEVKDNGDPLLFIESLPYYETRAYVNIVMRNYWMYQIQAKGSAECLTGMAQGMWPTFPTAKGVRMVRLSHKGNLAAPSIAGGSD
jgi:soluble lytic murein transglycosylase-like protein